VGLFDLWQQIKTNLDGRTAAASGLIVMATLMAMLLGRKIRRPNAKDVVM
jgi:hypothetical protein